MSGEELNATSSYIVFLNGLILGLHRQPHSFAHRVRSMRRRGGLLGSNHAGDGCDDASITR